MLCFRAVRRFATALDRYDARLQATPDRESERGWNEANWGRRSARPAATASRPPYVISDDNYAVLVGVRFTTTSNRGGEGG